MRKFLREMGKLVLSLVIVLGGLVATAYVVDRWKSHSMREFCASVSENDTAAIVIRRAERMGYLVIDATIQRGTVVVLNQRAPMFRYSCSIQFEDGRIVEKRTQTAD